MSTKEPTTGKTGFFASGKIDIGFEVKDGYVYGICLLYPLRTDQEHEYMIREKSIVAIGERDLSACVEDAKDFAYKSAISRLESAETPAFAERLTVQAAPVLGAVETDKEKPGDTEKNNAVTEKPQNEPSVKMADPPAEPPASEPPKTDEQEQGDELDPDNDMQGEEDGDDTGDVSDFKDEGSSEPESVNGIQRLDLNLGLQPAANLLNDAPAAQTPAPAASVDANTQKALDMPITILGKLHGSFGKTAGEILETDPQCIVDFAHRYTGPKVEEKEALVKLYPEALRRVQSAA